jgi:hypothetical protein
MAKVESLLAKGIGSNVWVKGKSTKGKFISN